TADELWQSIPGKRDDFVFTRQWYVFPSISQHAVLGRDDWQRVMAIKAAVNKVMEAERNAGRIGGSLQAEVELYGDESIFQLLSTLEDELRFVLITSSAQIKAFSYEGVETDLKGLRVSVKKSLHPNCVRCWHYRQDVGAHQGHEEICGRCVTNIEGDGEVRRYV